MRGAIARRSLLAAAIGCAALFSAMLAAPAGAFHIPGASYQVSVFGSPVGGFTVSADGSGISEAHTSVPIPGNNCTFTSVSTTYIQPLPIVNHSFNDTTPPLTFSGTFNAVRQATGTARISSGGCTTGTLPFTATTSASPAGSEECKAAQASLASAQKKVKKAKKQVKEAQSPSEKVAAQKKLKKAKKQRQAAQAQVTAVCG
jgi:hypothetical protein